MEKLNDSDSDNEMDYHTYEKKREMNVRQIVILDRLFTNAKKDLYKERLNQVLFLFFSKYFIKNNIIL